MTVTPSSAAPALRVCVRRATPAPPSAAPARGARCATPAPPSAGLVRGSGCAGRVTPAPLSDEPARGTRARRATGAVLARARAARGQASIELLGMLPLVALVALAVFTVLASHTAGEQAGEAAEAGALALLQGGGDARVAALGALPAAARSRATVTVAGGHVRVQVRPRSALPIPGLADRLVAEARAVARP